MPLPTSLETVRASMRALPKPLLEFLESESTTDVMIGILNDYFPTKPPVRLSQLVGWLVCGLISTQEFSTELAKIAPPGKFGELRSDVVKKVFMPFSTQLHEHGINFEAILSATTEKVSPAVSAVPSPEPEAVPPPKPAPPPLVISAAPPKPPTPAPAPTIPAGPVVVPSKPIAPSMPAAAAPQPAIPPRPTALPRITITSQQPGVPAALEETTMTKEEKPETGPRPIRYTPPPVIREVPRVIPPSGAPKPAAPQPTGGASKPAITPQPQKPQAPVIDLSTFQVTTNTPPNAPANPSSQPPQPKAKGNVLDLKP